MKEELTKQAEDLIKENPQLINTLARVLSSNIEKAVLEHGRDTIEENIIDDITGLLQDSISDLKINY